MKKGMSSDYIEGYMDACHEMKDAVMAQITRKENTIKLQVMQEIQKMYESEEENVKNN